MAIVIADTLEAALDTARGVLPSQKAQVRQYVDKYLLFFGSTTTPKIEIKDNIGSKWLGRTLWRTTTPDNTVIELQKAILADPKTMERVIAHEIVHHVELTTMTPEQVQAARMGIPYPSHGASFKRLSSQVNEAAGEDFVTEKSDETYELASTKYFYILIVPGDVFNLPGKYLYAWSAGLPKKDKPQRWVQNILDRGGRLFRTNHRPFSVSGAKFGEGRWTLPEGDDQDLLKQIYAQGG